jgi:heme/copper-type cytochrome/quinol oxidase subunit 3
VRTTFEQDDLKARKIYLYVFYFCAFVMASVTFYAIYVSLQEYLQTGKVVIGQVLVETEFPIKGLAKLTTYLMISSVVGWYCVVRLGGEKAKSIPRWLKSILQLIVLVFAVVALYEFVYNFIIWNSLITADAIRGVMRFDDLSVEYPDPEAPWNLVFATKMTLAAFLISAHCFYTISKSDKKSD